jgi:uncharacterized glyoxalase superfamily protein PhnB
MPRIQCSEKANKLAYPDLGKAIDWLCGAFDFTLRLRIANHRAQLNIGDGAVVLIERPVTVGQDSHSVMVRVENADRHSERATESGARVLLSPADYPYDVEEWGSTPGQL